MKTGAPLRVSAERLHPRDAVFVYDETDRHLSNIVAVYAFDSSDTKPLTTDQVIDWVQARLGHSKLFHRRIQRVPLELDLPYWVPDPILDIRDHVFLTTPGTWSDVRGTIAEITSTRMDLSRPPWEIHVMDQVREVPNFPGDATFVVLKFHHSVGDGVATRELELKLFGDGPVPPPAQIDPRWPTPTTALRTADALTLGTLRFANGIRRTRSADVESRTDSGDLHQPLPHRPATRFNRSVQHPLTFDLVTIPLAEVLKAKANSPTRITLNDLMLATIAGALTTYLTERDELPTGSLAAMVPMSMRPITTWTSANQLVQMYVDLHTDIRDPLERLQAIRKSAISEKQRNSDVSVLRTESRVETSPSWLLRLAGWARSQRSFEAAETVPLVNTTISNVPPVATALEFCDRPIARIFGVLPTMDGDGLRHLITSQGNEIVISFSSDDAMMPDPERYGSLILDAFRDLAGSLVPIRQ
ncbi:wax ester/triacylglycerol synthase family O-acyltransferase [Nocardia sp. NPDC059180]|uniref:wax ester/triacylglycerol synthase family O-acyltransferase n=1 Tax=Nocardia sp. NPDC059180 TaxID=3346761 RepID=UPI0036AF36D7